MGGEADSRAYIASEPGATTHRRTVDDFDLTDTAGRSCVSALMFLPAFPVLSSIRNVCVDTRTVMCCSAGADP